MSRNLTILIFLATFKLNGAQGELNQTNQFQVTDSISLSEIAIRAYGNPKKWKEIASFNHLKAPYRIKLGQILKLKTKPTLTLTQGNLALLKFWRGRLGVEVKSDQKDSVTSSLDDSIESKKSILSPEIISAESNFKQAVTLYRAKKYSSAREFFKLARSLNPDDYASWFYEINCLKAEKNFEAASQLASQLRSLHPELAEMPALSESALHEFSETEPQ